MKDPLHPVTLAPAHSVVKSAIGASTGVQPLDVVKLNLDVAKNP